MLRYQVYRPDHSLSSVINYYWLLIDPVGMTSDHWDLLIPDGQTEIILNNSSAYERSGLSGASKSSVRSSCIVGQRNQSILAGRAQRTELVGVKLRPGALYRLTGIPEKEFRNQVVPLKDVLKEKLGGLEEMIFSTDQTEQKWMILDHFFKKNIDRDLPWEQRTFYYLMNYIHHRDAPFNLEAIRKTFDLHPKKLERMFQKYVGLSPKNYFKIVRFKNAYKRFNREKVRFYDKTIYDLGYYDQMHFIKEFSHFTHQAPTDYYRQAGNIKDDILLDTIRQLKGNV